MMLGQENVMDLLEQYLTVTKEIHLRGIKGYKEHLSLSVLPENLVHKQISYLVSIHKWPFLPCSAFSADFRLRHTDVRRTANPCACPVQCEAYFAGAALRLRQGFAARVIRTKIAHF